MCYESKSYEKFISKSLNSIVPSLTTFRNVTNCFVLGQRRARHLPDNRRHKEVDELVVVDALVRPELGKMLLNQTKHQVAELKIDRKRLRMKSEILWFMGVKLIQLITRYFLS